LEAAAESSSVAKQPLSRAKSTNALARLLIHCIGVARSELSGFRDFFNPMSRHGLAGHVLSSSARKLSSIVITAV
jgi:hypothetical protein